MLDHDSDAPIEYQLTWSGRTADDVSTCPCRVLIHNRETGYEQCERCGTVYEEGDIYELECAGDIWKEII